MAEDTAYTGGKPSHRGVLLVLLTECPNVFLQRKQCVREVCYGQTAVASRYVLNELIKTSNEETWYQTYSSCPKIIPPPFPFYRKAGLQPG